MRKYVKRFLRFELELLVELLVDAGVNLLICCLLMIPFLVFWVLASENTAIQTAVILLYLASCASEFLLYWTKVRSPLHRRLPFQ